MKKYLTTIACIVFATALSSFTQAKVKATPEGEYYQLNVYHFKTNNQIEITETYLQNSYLPTLHGIGIKNIGVFTSIDNDTAADKKLYVLVPIKGLNQLADIPQILTTKNDTSSYTSAAYNQPSFERIETIVLKSFELMPRLQTPQLTAAFQERVYELRSYEAPTPLLYRQKVKMFNAGGEIALFRRLGFNAVFYAEVLAGSKMPNLMYMTTFNNRADREAHWKTFSSDTEWKTLSALPEYLHTVSKADIYFLRPTSYSDY
ncbi:NIPSNAP family protein [Parasediminibacterium paludis]|uniref:NIPSNAP family protein n=1 Tax=Parasediminibacterium paludis TaxID=908966 RepID=A0ABV8Q1S6_9BACT